MNRTPITVSLTKAKTILQQQGEIVIVPILKTKKEYINLQTKLGANPYFLINDVDIHKDRGDLLEFPYYKFRLFHNSCLTRAKLGEILYSLPDTTPKW